MVNKRMLKQVQELEKKLVKAQEELGNTTVEASSGGGAVTVVATGQQELRSIKISPEVVNPEEVEFLEDLVLAAVNEALQKSKEMATKRLEALTGGIKLPGLF